MAPTCTRGGVKGHHVTNGGKEAKIEIHVEIRIQGVETKTPGKLISQNRLPLPILRYHFAKVGSNLG